MPGALAAAEATKPKGDTPPYGFLSIHSGLFPAGIHGDLNDLGPAGESLSVDERTKKCGEREEAKFDAGQYQSVALLSSRPFAARRLILDCSTAFRRGDFVYDDEITELIRWKAPWAEAAGAEPKPDDVFFTEAEKTTLASLETTDARQSLV